MWRGTADQVAPLAAAGVDPDALDRRRMTAAMVAIHLNRPDVLKELLDAGANPDLESYSWIYRDTRRPLTVATYLGNRAAVAMLLDAGADLNQVYYDTAVHVAARHARTEIVRELLERGAESIRTATNRHPAARNHRGTHRRLRCARPHRKSAGGCGRGPQPGRGSEKLHRARAHPASLRSVPDRVRRARRRGNAKAWPVSR